MIKKTSVSVCLSLLMVACQQHQVSNTSSTFAVTQSTPIMVTESQKEPSLGYMSSISADGTSVVVKLPDGQERELSSAAPSYSATIGAISVQGKNNHLVINSSTPTVSASGKVTGNGLFKPPSAPEGAHWQLIKLNGQDIDAKGSPRPPYLRMSANKMQGLTGCNVMSGFYNRNQEHDMQFIQVQGTTQKCPKYQALESDFIAALQKLRVWKITPEDHLQFLDDKQQVVAEFVALSP